MASAAEFTIGISGTGPIGRRAFNTLVRDYIAGNYPKGDLTIAVIGPEQSSVKTWSESLADAEECAWRTVGGIDTLAGVADVVLIAWDDEDDAECVKLLAACDRRGIKCLDLGQGLTVLDFTEDTTVETTLAETASTDDWVRPEDADEPIGALPVEETIPVAAPAADFIEPAEPKRRTRRTKAQIEADKAAEAAKSDEAQTTVASQLAEIEAENQERFEVAAEPIVTTEVALTADEADTELSFTELPSSLVASYDLSQIPGLEKLISDAVTSVTFQDSLAHELAVIVAKQYLLSA